MLRAMNDGQMAAALRPVLRDAIAAGTTPGAQLAVSSGDLPTWVVAEGALDYEGGASVTPDTVYDLASVTKPFTALAAVRLAAAGRLSLDETLGSLWPGRFGAALASLSLDALLSHRAGLPAWIDVHSASALDDCGSDGARARALDAIDAVALGEAGTALYSDLGYILAGEAIAHREALAIDAVVRREVIDPLELPAVRARGVGPRWRDPSVAPTERCPWRGRVVQGEVHDENAYALGGVAGHAGIFGTATALAALGRRCIDALRGRSDWASAAAMAATIAPREGGSHRLGWDGVTPGASSSGSHFGPRSFGHLGFTGTSLWCDPDRDLVVALVTNRVHPRRDALGIRALRPRVHDAIIPLLRGNA